MAFVCFIVIKLFALSLWQPPIDDVITVATWNIEHLRAENGVGANPRDDEDYALLAEYVAELDADIVALQEVDGPEAAARIFEPDDYQFFFTSRNHTQRTGFAVRNALTVTQHPDFVTLDTTGGLRFGADISVQLGDQSFRLLAVHLKSGCHGDPITRISDACNKLRSQIPVLESWIDARAAEEIPFAVLGDFNRRFDDPDDTVWEDLDDAEPINADLSNPTIGLRSECWDGEFPLYIDHIVLDRQTTRWMVPDSFVQVLFDEPEQLKDVLSDHCPISVALMVADADDDADGDVERDEKLRAHQRILVLVQEIEERLAEIRQLLAEIGE